MDIVIKNIECLRNDIDGHTQTPPKRVVVDFSKAGTDEFAQLFFNSCEEYDEAEDGFLLCDTCKYQFVDEDKDPCRSCLDSASRKMNWESKGPNLKEVTERMQSEFDATGKDVAYFMNHRVKPGGINND